MKIAVINSGSSSVKFALYEMEKKELLAHLVVEEIGDDSSKITLKYDDEKVLQECKLKNHHVALEKVVELLAQHHIIDDFGMLDAIGHRVVHGAELFTEPTLITDEVIKDIDELSFLAPLHNPPNLEGILVARKLAPNVPQIAVFDTAFHSTIREEAYLYAVDFETFTRNHIRKYGFHGISHSYILSRCAKEMKKDEKELSIISLHLGNGSSACAIKDGESVDTSMGFTPLDGLIMGTRSGDLDPAIPLYLQRTLGMDIDAVNTLLNERSGLYGISGESDVRILQERTDDKAKLALKMMARRIKKYIGFYMLLLAPKVDAIVFTAGIGEHSSKVRELVMKDFGWEVELDKKANNANETLISKADSSIPIYVLPTNEELEIAKQAQELLSSKQ